MLGKQYISYPFTGGQQNIQNSRPPFRQPDYEVYQVLESVKPVQRPQVYPQEVYPQRVPSYPERRPQTTKPPRPPQPIYTESEVYNDYLNQNQNSNEDVRPIIPTSPPRRTQRPTNR